MSKALTMESAADDEDDEDHGRGLDPSFRLPAGTRNYITPAGHARIRAEVEQLLRVERPQLVSVVQWAASNGDRSENADYIYGKRRLREIDRRIRFLTKRLDLAEIVDPAGRAGTEQVFFGATVTICDEQGSEQTYRIVGVDETDFARGRVSWVSPLARALLKSRAGDTVRFQSPAGSRTVDVVEVAYRAIDD
ncbi:MAG TPA: transcription elongation factor GreB [Accumulibacter sp.]|uniref:transcription elongation factor GreB n=1 Tax=Accumulibacter sp. TaxID=2053492 RepID=UPI000EBC80C7|nr:transcription elongation factor GreB [Accumulibacter sp.]HCZ16768.1 transcription elongation factor GreB [Accumulibacter sp.]HRF71960.1 transcription elongation factor GreB [Accumulibacter sp.]